MPAFNVQRARQALRLFDFQTLFIEELGWDYAPNVPLDVVVDGETFTLTTVAEKRNVAALRMQSAGAIPAYAIRRKIEHKVADVYREHIIIYVDADRTTQIWQWVRREPGKPLSCREHHYTPQQAGDALLQKLQTIAFSLEEEEGLTLVDVTGRLRAAFNVERATKQFYDRFKKERDAFARFLAGVPDETMESWYVSVMLDRLMFIYFIQKKGFLQNDLDYLRHKLVASQTRGVDRFYRDFLCPLFFQGFALPPAQRPPEVHALLGDVPYLNGGIFQPHEVEQRYGKSIRIPDAAFQGVFAFFDEYQWHLDDRPLRNDREINPDVLGYIFEKYINQKQMGAYYTQEDITGYIGENTILPYLFDRVRGMCPDAFSGDDAPFDVAHGKIWTLLSADPDRYIYAAVRKGCDRPLPPEIAAGVDDVSQREQWNTPTSDDYALPTEIWRETVARRQRYAEVRAKLAAGEVVAINDLITYNLDIQQFAQDVLESTENPALLWAFWRALNAISILDPTCGSGAFLFAALNLLELLYSTCLERMAAFIREWEAEGRARRGHFKDFAEVLARVAQHPNQTYFVLKSIIVNNLYGVDIMAEAVEIAKLRLFLKLVAQIERAADIEPLPDIDFNIRAGNTLVGFATYDEVEKAVYQEGAQMKLMLGDNPMVAIEQKAQDVDRLYQRFREQQTTLGGEVTPADKAALHQRLDALTDELDRYLAKEYGVDPDLPMDFYTWRASHQPFHWFVEFYGIMQGGGFDVIIGNPPYVEYSKIQKDYQLHGYETDKAGNLYAFVTERSVALLKQAGRLGFVLQQPVVSTNRMETIRDVLLQNSSFVWSSTYDDRPSKLFDGIHHARIAILLVEKSKTAAARLYVTAYQKWYKEQRNVLFQKLAYIEDDRNYMRLSVFPKIGSSIEAGILDKLLSISTPFALWTVRHRTQFCTYHKITGVGHWFTITQRPPKFIREGVESSSTREKAIFYATKEVRDRALAVLNSSLFYWFYQVRTNCRDFNPSDYQTFPIPPLLDKEDFSIMAAQLQKALDDSSAFYTMRSKQTGLLQVEQFRPRIAKPIIDEIDRVLARHYGFTDEELDFIINYDIKYRMGDALFEDEEEEE